MIKAFNLLEEVIMEGIKKLWKSSTFQLILATMITTAFIAYGDNNFTWKDWVGQLDMYITTYVIKEAVKYGAAAYQAKSSPTV